MLNSLLKTLKSQKSSKPCTQPQTHSSNTQSQYSTEQYKIPKKCLDELQSNILQCPLKKIRYLVLPNLPNIFNQVMACPISVFHYLPHGMRKVKEIDLRTQKSPTYLQFLKELLDVELADWNHVLINHYKPGVGIMPHTDGPAYRPKVVVLSLNSPTIITFQLTPTALSQQHIPSICRLLLEPNSIHIFEQEAYTTHLHGIQNLTIDCILIKYNKESRKVEQANIDNYEQLACRGEWEKVFQYGADEVFLGNGLVRIVRLVGNQSFTHKVEIQRKERISITLRHKYQQ